MASQPFTYSPLTGRDSIRLLVLQPSSLITADIHCQLLHTSLSQCSNDIFDHYIALSYVWGDASQQRTIYVDDRPFSVTLSLESALRDLRDETRVLRLWADAVCIDQSNIDERNTQVHQMGEIYRSAHHTVIYLGSLSEAASVVLDAIQSRNPAESDPPAFIQAAQEEFMLLPWFSRVWVFQELILGRDQWVQCGRWRVRWTAFCEAFFAPTWRRSANIVTNSPFKILADMEAMRSRPSDRTLLDLLQSRRGLGATDPRDMVFAHMGIASDRGEWDSELIRVDYGKTCKQVYEDLARYFIKTKGIETFFAHLACYQPTKTSHSNISRTGVPGLASWAPDWSLPALATATITRESQYTPRLHPSRDTMFLEQGTLAILGRKQDLITAISLELPSCKQLNFPPRSGYSKAMQDLRIGCGPSEKEKQLRLLDRIYKEWVHFIEDELPNFASKRTPDELIWHYNFTKAFNVWLEVNTRSRYSPISEKDETTISFLARYLDPNNETRILDGLRLAVTKGGNLGVVSAAARPGDIVAYLDGSYISVLIRDTPVTVGNALVVDKIRKAFADAGKIIRKQNTFGGLFSTGVDSVKKCKLIGECFIDGLKGPNSFEFINYNDPYLGRCVFAFT